MVFSIVAILSIIALSSSVDASDWIITVIDSTNSVGKYPSLVLDGMGYPHISYYDITNENLKYATWTGSSWNIVTVDSANSIGECTAIALDSNGYPHISYSDYTNEALKYAYWTGSGWNKITVDSMGVGEETSIALDNNDNPHISYLDWQNENLKYAKWNGSNWDIQTVDSVGDVGWDTSITLDSNGYAHISYAFESGLWDTDLKYAKWNGNSWNIVTVDSQGIVGYDSSIKIDSNDNPHISYWYNPQLDEGRLKYASWSGSGWNIETVDSGGIVGEYTSLELDSNEHPHISYHDYSNEDLKYASWTGTGWDVETVDTPGYVGLGTSLSIDSNDTVYIAYWDVTNGDLKIATTGQLFPGEPPAQGELVAHYQFDENTGTHLFDSTPNYNGGTIYGANWTTGVNGSALIMDGVDDYVTCGHSLIDGTFSQFTIMAWVNSRDFDESYYYFFDGSDGEFTIATIVDNSASFGIKAGNGNHYYVHAPSILIANQWHHLTGVYNGTSIKLFVDGVLVNETSIPDVGLFDPTGNYYPTIGAYNGPGDSHQCYVNGKIDELRIYNYALSDGEIKNYSEEFSPTSNGGSNEDPSETPGFGFFVTIMATFFAVITIRISRRR